VLGQAWVYGWSEDREAAFEGIHAELQIALALDDSDSDVHRILAAANLIQRDYDRAMYHQERALGLNPNNDLIVVQQGELLTWLGRPEEGIAWIRNAMRLNPYHPERYWNHLGRAYFVARRYPEAIEAFSRITSPDHTHYAFLAAASAAAGDQAAARTYATLHYKREADHDHHRDALLKAGLAP
jgi:adenylate cyclase